MKKIFLVLFVLSMAVQVQGADIFRQEGIASWYGREFEGRPTASGEIFDSSKLTAAHPNLPFGTMLVVTNQHNNKKVTVRVNDRGPFVAARIIDVSRAAAQQLDMIVTGTAPVLVESVEKIAISAPPEPVKPAPPVALSPPVKEVPLVVVAAPPVVPTPTPPVVAATSPVVAATPPVVAATPPVYTPAPVQQPVTPAPPAAVDAHTSASVRTKPADVYVSPPVAVQASHQIRLTPEIDIVQNKSYRLQIGSFKVARNAVDVFERLKNAGLSPAYERHTDGAGGEYFRVVLAGVRGIDVQSTAEKLRASGFREALVREEN